MRVLYSCVLYEYIIEGGRGTGDARRGSRAEAEFWSRVKAPCVMRGGTRTCVVREGVRTQRGATRRTSQQSASRTQACSDSGKVRVLEPSTRDLSACDLSQVDLVTQSARANIESSPQFVSGRYCYRLLDLDCGCNLHGIGKFKIN